jgi:hypothetical protein
MYAYSRKERYYIAIQLPDKENFINLSEKSDMKLSEQYNLIKLANISRKYIVKILNFNISLKICDVIKTHKNILDEYGVIEMRRVKNTSVVTVSLKD